MTSTNRGGLNGLTRLFAALALAAMLALTLAHGASAAPVSGKIKAGVSVLVNACQGGGGAASVTQHYKGNTLVSADVSCTGGSIDGVGCSFTGKSTVCSGRVVQEPNGPLSGIINGGQVVGAVGASNSSSPTVSSTPASGSQATTAKAP